jgi:fluoride ion exporter CrcB/FEX
LFQPVVTKTAPSGVLEVNILGAVLENIVLMIVTANAAYEPTLAALVKKDPSGPLPF